MSYSKNIKGKVDKLAAGLLLMVAMPFLLILMLSLLITQGWKIIFVQKRTGKNGRPFDMYKFRTLCPDARAGLELQNRKYTPLGGILRKSGVDELPQLINVIKGDMSLIGPRPLPIEYLPGYNDFQKQRMLVKPGLTGWAQLHGRNATSWNSRFALDVWYTRNMSWRLDLKIFTMTMVWLLKRIFNPKLPEVVMPVFHVSKNTAR